MDYTAYAEQMKLKEQQRYEDLQVQARRIAEHLPGTWRLQVQDPDTYDYVPRFVYLTGPDGRELRLNYYGNVHGTRLEIAAAGWPEYRDVDGTLQRVHPHTTNQAVPSTTADCARDPKAIAGQVERRVLQPLDELLPRLRGMAELRGKHADKHRYATLRLAGALGCEDPKEVSRGRIYARNIPGAPLVEYRSAGDVRLSVTAEEAVELLQRLRELRTQRPGGGA